MKLVEEHRFKAYSLYNLSRVKMDNIDEENIIFISVLILTFILLIVGLYNG